MNSFELCRELNKHYGVDQLSLPQLKELIDQCNENDSLNSIDIVKKEYLSLLEWINNDCDEWDSDVFIQAFVQNLEVIRDYCSICGEPIYGDEEFTGEIGDEPAHNGCFEENNAIN